MEDYFSHSQPLLVTRSSLYRAGPCEILFPVSIFLSALHLQAYLDSLLRQQLLWVLDLGEEPF